MMWNYFGHMAPGYYGFGWIFMILFWALIIWAIVSLVRGFSEHGCCGSEHKGKYKENNNALNILKERYAKGEISKEDFDKMKKDLE